MANREFVAYQDQTGGRCFHGPLDQKNLLIGRL
jgi:hypothetical protein